MPEGPEILYTCLYLKKFLKNCKIEDILSYTDKPAVIPKDDYIGVVEDVGAKGKSFWIKVSSFFSKKMILNIAIGPTFQVAKELSVYLNFHQKYLNF